MKMQRFLHYIFAIGITLISAAMVLYNALFEDTLSARAAILAGFSLVICLGVHFLLTWTSDRMGLQRFAAYTLWFACLIVTTYNQVSFFTKIGVSEGEARIRHSVELIGESQQIESVNQAISQISARPVAAVARSLAQTRDEKKSAALHIELEEARRAERLHDLLISLQSHAVISASNISKDPTIALLEAVTHSNAVNISITVKVFSTLVLELLSAFLWYQIRSPHISQPAAEVKACTTDELQTIKSAVDSGKIKPTVKAIRLLLNCSQNRASILRNQFQDIGSKHVPNAL